MQKPKSTAYPPKTVAETRDHGIGMPDSATLKPSISRRARPGQCGKVRVVIPARHPDNAALLSAGQEWLIPLLVRDFLRERSLEPVSGTDSTKRKQVDYGIALQGARATTRELN